MSQAGGSPSPAIRVLTLLISCLSGACGEPPGPRLDAELVGALGLRGDEVVHRVTLSGRGAEERVVPGRLEIRPGDLVEFYTADHRVHAVAFPDDSLTPDAKVFLERTRQKTSPPLVQRGSRFVMTFENAPPGRYPFVSNAHGGAAGGVIVVAQDGPDRRRPP